MVKPLKINVSQKYLKSIFSYDPDVGIFVKIDDGRKVNKTPKYNKYLRLKINGINYPVHRLAFLYMTGKVPDMVDHINRKKNDNRWCNLRECTHPQNMANAAAQKNNKSGYKGVSWRKSHKAWLAMLMSNGENIFLGYYKDKNDAATAYNNASIRINGEFAYINEII